MPLMFKLGCSVYFFLAHPGGKTSVLMVVVVGRFPNLIVYTLSRMAELQEVKVSRDTIATEVPEEPDIIEKLIVQVEPEMSDLHQQQPEDIELGSTQ